MRKYKFTLIELLIVIAIIGILAAILLPVLSKSKERGRQVVCMSNLKQIGMATTLYTDDNKNFYPQMDRTYVGVAGKRGNYGGNWWGNAERLSFGNRPLDNYLGAPDIAECPSDNGNSMTSNAYEGHGISYLTAHWSHGPVVDGKFRIAKVYGNHPGEELRVSKSTVWVGGKGGYSNKILMGEFPFNRQNDMSQDYPYWHNDFGTRQYNVLFADYHVEFFEFDFDLGDDGAVPYDPNDSFW